MTIKEARVRIIEIEGGWHCRWLGRRDAYCKSAAAAKTAVFRTARRWEMLGISSVITVQWEPSTRAGLLAVEAVTS